MLIESIVAEFSSSDFEFVSDRGKGNALDEIQNLCMSVFLR